MEIMPPPGSKRRRVAIGLMVGFMALTFVGTVEALVKWMRHEASFPGTLLWGWLATVLGLRLMWVASRKEESRESEGLDQPAGERIQSRVPK